MVEGQHLGKCSGGSPDQNRRRHDLTSFVDEMVGFAAFFFAGGGFR